MLLEVADHMYPDPFVGQEIVANAEDERSAHKVSVTLNGRS